MAEIPVVRGNIMLTNVGETSISIDNSQVLEPGENLTYSLFKGVIHNGEVRTGTRSFKIRVLGDVPFGELSTGDKFSAFLDEVKEQGCSQRNIDHWKEMIDSLQEIVN